MRISQARAPLDNNIHLCKINVMNDAQANAELSLLIRTFSKLIIHKRVHDVCRRRPPTENAENKTKKCFQLCESHLHTNKMCRRFAFSPVPHTSATTSTKKSLLIFTNYCKKSPNTVSHILHSRFWLTAHLMATHLKQLKTERER